MAMTKVSQNMIQQVNDGGGGVIRGLMVSNDLTSPGTFFVVSDGNAQDSVSGVIMRLKAGMRKNLNAPFAAGQDLGCLDTGTAVPGTWYHLFLIYNPTTRLLDILASVSISNPALPAGYTIFERIFSVWYNATEVIEPFLHNRYDEILWVIAPVSVSSVADGQGIPRVRTVLVPPGMKFKAYLLHIVTGAVQFGTGLMDPDLASPGGYAGYDYWHYININSYYDVHTVTNSNSQVASYSNTPNAGDSVISIVSKGYVDPRRKL